MAIVIATKIFAMTANTITVGDTKLTTPSKYPTRTAVPSPMNTLKYVKGVYTMK
jgi:hypothetical protein